MAMSISNLKERYRRRLVKNNTKQSRTDSAGFVLVDAILNEIRYMLKELESRQLKSEAEKSANNPIRVDYSWLKTNTSLTLRHSPKKILLSNDEAGDNNVTLANQQRLFSDIENLSLTLTAEECGHVLKAFKAIHEAWDQHSQKPDKRDDLDARDVGSADTSESLNINVLSHDLDVDDLDVHSHEAPPFISPNNSSENLISSADITDSPDDRTSSSLFAKLSPSRVLQAKNSPSKESRRDLATADNLGQRDTADRQQLTQLFLCPPAHEDCSEMLLSSENLLRGVHKIIINIVAQREEGKAKGKLFSKKLHDSRGKSRWPALTRSFISRSLEDEPRSDKSPEPRMTLSWSNLKIRPGSRAAVVPSDEK